MEGSASIAQNGMEMYVLLNMHECLCGRGRGVICDRLKQAENANCYDFIWNFPPVIDIYDAFLTSVKTHVM